MFERLRNSYVKYNDVQVKTCFRNHLILNEYFGKRKIAYFLNFE